MGKGQLESWAEDEPSCATIDMDVMALRQRLQKLTNTHAALEKEHSELLERRQIHFHHDRSRADTNISYPAADDEWGHAYTTDTGTPYHGKADTDVGTPYHAKVERKISGLEIEMDDDDEDELVILEATEAKPMRTTSGLPKNQDIGDDGGQHFNYSILFGSALNMRMPFAALTYALALGGVVFVIAAQVSGLGALDAAHDDDHRRLAGAAPAAAGEVPTTESLMLEISFSFFVAGLVAFFVNLLNLPLILGYLLGGVLVGPTVLSIVPTHTHIQDISSLGLVFLLFMIGLELDVMALLKMGKVVLVTGLLQFPICAIIMFAIFTGLEGAGISFGTGEYSAMYCGMTCGISSTMIVVKLLSERMDMDSAPGRLTVGILIFQDIWAIVVLAIQPNLANPEIVGILKTFGLILVLLVVGIAYAKFVMPMVFLTSSKSIEVMLVLALAWCFFIGDLAILPFMGLSIELASLISGVALATFPYSAEFNGKIKYIRDFFITLFFVGLGMQIPVPSIDAILKAVIVAIVVLIIRWVGIFLVVLCLGGKPKLAVVSTINLSEISEFALVICSLGEAYGHVGKDTLTILIWTFSILAILASYLITFNYRLYGMISYAYKRCRGKDQNSKSHDGHEEDHEHEHRDILFLGFHKIAAQLIHHIEVHTPAMLRKIHVVDSHEAIMPILKKKGLTCAYGDISSKDVLEHAHHGEARLIISSVPDSALNGITNVKILTVAKGLWPQAHVITVADDPLKASELYENGADYVIRLAKLCAEQLTMLITEHCTHTFHHDGELGTKPDVFGEMARHDLAADEKQGTTLFH
mmetsp:Transcript_64619/g.140684  ORF Transcript_64619/g.140684 Transcript_64619/m.140684 type:complete len:813 (+) Transcript_64619:60-2498(+)